MRDVQLRGTVCILEMGGGRGGEEDVFAIKSALMLEIGVREPDNTEKGLELLETGRHRIVRRRPALLAPAPDALVLADARPAAILALAPQALVLAEG